jgi:hypothetical protein
VRNLLLLASLLAACTVISGCAGTAKGIESSVFKERASNSSLELKTPEAAALVIIRYPAMIHFEAENLFISSYAVNAIGGDGLYSVFGKTQTSRIVQAVMAKSSYFAMSLYRELKEKLPEGSVLLSPHIIVWDDERQMHSRPILASEQIPGVLTIDFNVYSFPDATELMESPPVTFGDLVTPLVTVKSSRWLSPALNGLLISSEPLTEAAWRQSRVQTNAHLQRRLEGRAEDRFASLEFVSFLAERNAVSENAPAQAAGQPVSHSSDSLLAIEQYGVEKIRMNGEQVADLVEVFPTDPFESAFTSGFASRIIRLLGLIDIDRATYLDRQNALSRFDPELAKVFFLQSTDESVRARLQLAEALIGAERKFLAAQSESVYEGTYQGSFGTKMRKVIQSEYHVLEERRHIARVQNVTAAVAAIAMAGTVYGASLTTTANALVVSSLTGLSLVGSIWAINASRDSKAESEEVAEYFSNRMAPSVARQMSVQMEWLESKEVITARGFAEFRNKTLSLYQARVRSMSVEAGGQCEFVHRDFTETGRWYGQCMDGRASGRGYGVVINAQGSSVEYLGDALDGLASGTGGMMIRSNGRNGSMYLEGTFREGRPDAAMRIEQAGKSKTVRLFDAGKDIGRGEVNQVQKLAFSSNWAEQGVIP